MSYHAQQRLAERCGARTPFDLCLMRWASFGAPSSG
jgi:hypothetical protein